MIARAAFWGAAALVGWTYVGFPLTVLARARLWPRPHLRRAIGPSVSVVLAARNEERAIGDRIENLLGVDYPADLLEIVVASDGSTDATPSIVERYADRGVRLLDLPWVGKATALTRAVEASSGEIIVFTDANTSFRPDAIQALVASFADPAVGGVAGNQRYLPPRGARDGTGERDYWDFDRRLKMAESAAGNTISATGAIYALRRELFEPIPEGVTDDFTTSTLVVARGRRLVFEPDAIAEEPVARSQRTEFGRKVRIMTRGLRAVALRRALLDPRATGFYAVQLASHKLLRRLMVFPLLVGFVASAVLAPRSRLHAALTACGIALGALGLAGLAAPETLGRRRVFALPAYFLLVNTASLVATWNIARGRRIARWEPQRTPAQGEDRDAATAVPRSRTPRFAAAVEVAARSR